MTYRWCSGCSWWEFISKCQAPRVVVWLYTRFPSCYGWMILIWVEGSGFLNSDSDQSLSPVNCTLLTQPLCLSLLPLFQSGNFDLFLRGVCVCVCVCGMVVGRGRKGDMIGDNASTWFHIFPYLFHFIFGPWLWKPQNQEFGFFFLVLSW